MADFKCKDGMMSFYISWFRVYTYIALALIFN